MGDRTQRQPSWLRTTTHNVPWLLVGKYRVACQIDLAAVGFMTDADVFHC